MKKQIRYIITTSIINLSVTLLSTFCYLQDKGIRFDTVSIFVLLISNIIYVNDLIFKFKEMYLTGVNRGKYEINTFKKEN